MSKLFIGWSEVNITPDKKISLAGQFAERISEYVEKPLTATAMAVEAEGSSAEALANEFLAEADLPFDGMVMPVEPGLLMGFGNVEITGFSEGVMFGPAISTIPFLGYVFQLEDGTDGAEFCQTLQEYCDLRWNICTEAEEVVAAQGGDYVFFLMCPSSLEG